MQLYRTKPHRGLWLLHEGVPVLVAENQVGSADESKTLAYSLLNNMPEVIVSGPQQQKYLKVADEAPSSSAAGTMVPKKVSNWVII